MDIAEIKSRIISEIDTRHCQLSEISLKIHSNPETNFEEVKAAAWLTEYLEKNGFSIKRGICELPTAFEARYGEGRPAIAILAEYDALPVLGHACGHNIIATSAVGAGCSCRDHQGFRTVACTATRGCDHGIGLL